MSYWKPVATGWSSSSNQDTWGNTWVNDSPTKEDIALRNKEILERKATINIFINENFQKILITKENISAANKVSAQAEKTLQNAQAWDNSAADIAFQKTMVALTLHNEYALRIELASSEAFQRHSEADLILADASSLAQTTKESRQKYNLYKMTENEARGLDTLVSQMRTEYEKQEKELFRLKKAAEQSGIQHHASLPTDKKRLQVRLNDWRYFSMRQ